MGEVMQRFTPAALRVVQFAKEAARRAGGVQLGTEHLLLGLTRETEGIAARVLVRLGVTTRRVIAELAKRGAVSGEARAWNDDARRVLDAAVDEATRVNVKRGWVHLADTEHLLLAVIRDSNTASQILESLGVERGRVRQEVFQALAQAGAKEGQPEVERPEPLHFRLSEPERSDAAEPSAPAEASASVEATADETADESEPLVAQPFALAGPPPPPRVQASTSRSAQVTVAEPSASAKATADRPAPKVSSPLIDLNTYVGYHPRLGTTTTREDIRRAGARWGVQSAYTYHLNALLYATPAGNEETLAACAEDPYFRPVVVISPTTHRGPAMVEWAKERGFAFVRIFPDSHSFEVDGSACRDLLAECGTARLPVMIPSEAAGAASLRRALEAIEGTFILTDNRYGVLGEVLALAGRVADLYIEVSGVNTPDGIAQLAEAFGPERLLWGSGYPALEVGSGAMLLRFSGLRPEQIEMIAYRNAQRLLEGKQ